MCINASFGNENATYTYSSAPSILVVIFSASHIGDVNMCSEPFQQLFGVLKELKGQQVSYFVYFAGILFVFVVV
jgi:hypothetical protein